MCKITNTNFLEGFQYSFHYQCQVTIFSICYFKLWYLIKINPLCYSGANKIVSQRTSIAFYESAIDGVKSYHNTVMKGIEMNGCAVAPQKKLS